MGDLQENNNQRKERLLKVLTDYIDGYIDKNLDLEKALEDRDAIIQKMGNEARSPKIHSRCPACDQNTLGLYEGRLFCNYKECPDPNMVDHLSGTRKEIQRLKDEWGMLVDTVKKQGVKIETLKADLSASQVELENIEAGKIHSQIVNLQKELSEARAYANGEHAAVGRYYEENYALKAERDALRRAVGDAVATLKTVDAAFGQGPGDPELNPWIPGCIAFEVRMKVRAGIKALNALTPAPTPEPQMMRCPGGDANTEMCINGPRQGKRCSEAKEHPVKSLCKCVSLGCPACVPVEPQVCEWVDNGADIAGYRYTPKCGCVSDDVFEVCPICGLPVRVKGGGA
jgi:regulator of replication initiation timing